MLEEMGDERFKAANEKVMRRVAENPFETFQNIKITKIQQNHLCK